MMTEEIMNNVGEATEVAMEIVPEVSNTDKFGKAGKIGGRQESLQVWQEEGGRSQGKEKGKGS